MEWTEHIRLEQVYQQIIELASGNFSYRQPLSGKRDVYDTLAELLNMLSEELQHTYFNIPREGLLTRDPLHLTLNGKLEVRSTSPDLLSHLGMDTDWKDRGHKIQIRDLIDKGSYKRVREKLKLFENTPLLQSDKRLILDFKTRNTHYHRTSCLLHPLTDETGSTIYLLTVLEGFPKSPGEKDLGKSTEREAGNPEADRVSGATVILMRQVRLYILKNLHRPLPGLRELGLIHRTNQTKLKEGFKRMYGTTIFRFHLENRLDKAALLLSHTELPVSEVLRKYGFRDASHFSRKFKERFGVPPTIYRQRKRKKS